jgi:cbb3-type cytochrome oxidase subunit 3
VVTRECGRSADQNGARSMLWTILIILVIIALVVFILNRVRGGRGL